MKDYTDVTVVLDRSGSMGSWRSDVINGINGFLDDQSKNEKPVDVTLTQFDTEYQVDYESKNVKIAPRLNLRTYVPRGGTALYDAVGRTIQSMGARFSRMPENERPARVVLLVYTDGEENSSREYSQSKIRAMLEHQQSAYNWQVLFLGADLSAKVGTDMGINPNMAHTVSARSAVSNFESFSKSLTSYSRCATVGLQYIPPGAEEEKEVPLSIRTNVRSLS